MRDLDDRLRALRADVEWPATPDLAGPVVARLQAAPAAPRGAREVRRRRPFDLRPQRI